MKERTSFLVASLAFVLAAVARAHDTWLMPDRFEVAPKQAVTLDLTSGMAFPALETGPKRERIESAKCRLAGKTFDIVDMAAGLKSLVLKSKLSESGIATLWVKLPPKSIELKPEQVDEYLDEIDAPAALRKQWTETQDPRRWRELYSKHAKTFVRVGAPKTDRSWAEPVGLKLEIIPGSDPTRLRVGDELSVQILKGGAPFRDFAVNAVATGESKGVTRKTDAEGRLAFRLDKAGRWLLRGTDLRKSTNPEIDWESDFTTLTLSVMGK